MEALLTLNMALTELIPGLPNDLAVECFIRVQVDQFSKIASICKDWKCEIEQPEFWRRRKMAAFTSPIIVMAQAKVDTTPDSQEQARFFSMPVYRLTICDPERNCWNELPPIPGFPNGLPMFCQVVGVGLDLVVIGGCDPVSWKVLNTVFVFNFLSATWRRGADMPGGHRLFFGCASDSDRMVLVAGGHNDDKNALQSALAYDVAKNEWIQLPVMARQRDECQCVFHRGRFHVIGGYQTERQGRFERSAEIFDGASWQWCQQEAFLMMTSNFSRSCTEGGDGRFYVCQDGEVIVLEDHDGSWKFVTALPVEVRNVAYMAAWHNKLLVIGSERFGEPHCAAFVLDVNNNKSWTKLEVSDQYSGHVQVGCRLVI